MRKLNLKSKVGGKRKARRFSFSSLPMKRLVICGSITMLSTLSLAFLFPITSNSSSALSNTTTQASSRVSVKAAASVAVSLDRQVEIEVVPKSSGTFGYNSMRLGISTNNEEGYQIFLTTSDGSSTLKSTDSSKTGPMYEISSITQDTIGTSFAGNTWGYALSKNNINEKTTYSRVPTSSTSIYNTPSAPVETEDVYHLGFGTHVSTTLPAGEYSNSVVVSVIANPIKITSLNQLVYMQDMQPELCTNTAEGVTKQLYDIRDGKQYWVAKLKDGNCWMTQNLALDLGEGTYTPSSTFGTNLRYVKTLTPADSDVDENWTASSSTNEIVLSGEKISTDANNQYSWNLGEVVTAIPFSGQSCSGPLSSGETTENCAKAGIVDVSNQTIWQPTFSAQAGNYNGSSYDLIAADPERKTYDAHYLVGNFYHYNTATAGSGADAVAKDTVAAHSICPRGWTLPAFARNSSNQPIINPDQSKFSFYQLMQAYGYPETSGYLVDSNNAPHISLRNPYSNSPENFVAPPISLVRNGAVGWSGSWGIGGSGNYWSSSAFRNVSAYSLNFTNANVAYVANEHYRYEGYSIRCVAR